MDLATGYLGLRLDSPLVVGASPLADDLDDVRRLEDAGASCIVLRSLFRTHRPMLASVEPSPQRPRHENQRHRP